MTRQLNISASIHNLPPSHELTAGYNRLNDFLLQAGYHGYQYAWSRRPDRGRAIKRLAETGRITSLHQGFSGHCLTELPYRFMLGALEHTTSRLEPIQAAAGAKLPLIVHPNEQWLDNRPPDHHRQVNYRALRQSKRFGALLFQPTIELFEAWGIENDSDPADTAQRLARITTAEVGSQHNRGFTGIALDTYHLVARRAGEQLSVEQAVLLAGNLAALGSLGGSSELQVAFRPDWGDDPAHLDKALTGSLEHTPQGRIINAVAMGLPAQQRQLRITIEVPASAFARYGGFEVGNQLLVELLQSSSLVR